MTHSPPVDRGPTFQVDRRLPGAAGRTGRIRTPHGEIRTPAFIPVATQAALKQVLPEAMAGVGAQALLANAYHLYLQPGVAIVREAGGLGAFMNWPGPTFTDSGGFQVMSLGAGFKKTLAMDSATAASEVIAPPAKRLASVDDEGVTFRSHRDGTEHRFTAEVSMQVQHDIGADIIFAFDELTTLLDDRAYQEPDGGVGGRFGQCNFDETAAVLLNLGNVIDRKRIERRNDERVRIRRVHHGIADHERCALLSGRDKLRADVA